MLRISKLKHMRPLDGVGAPSHIYQAQSSDPRCRLKPARDGSLRELPPGIYQLFLTIFDLDGSVAQPAIYLDLGNGFREEKACRIPLSALSNEFFFAEIDLRDRRLLGLRLDPSIRQGIFAIGPIWIQPLADTGQHQIAESLGYRLVRSISTLLLRPGLNSSMTRLALLTRLFSGRLTWQELATGVISGRDRAALYRDAKARLGALRFKGDYQRLYETYQRNATGLRSEFYVGAASDRVDASRCVVKPIAFYLPQFHPIAQNDAWWGKGFTEWTNVAKAVPQFEGHYQPRLPGDLGYYDLRLSEVMREQVDIAKGYGLHGFCFHHYWFHGTRLLEKPVDTFLADQTMDFRFCLCWANENWTRRWDGAEHEVLIGQEHSAEDDLAFFSDLRRYLSDSRYICVDGKPLLIVYRPSLLPSPKETAARWREAAAKHGFPGLFLVATNAFEFTDPAAIGFDALVEFPPHGRTATEINHTLRLYNPEYRGLVYRYSEIAQAAPRRYPENALVIPAAMPSWDNEARRPGRGNVMHGSTPDLFRDWLDRCFLRAKENAAAHCPFVFINAWNEWAEGAYLEPDRRFGYAYLSVVAETIRAHGGVALGSR